MSYSRTSYNNRPLARVFAYLTTPAVTTVTTGGTFVPIEGTFNNAPFDGFTIQSDMITYIGEPNYFEIDWNATFSSADAGRTVEIGVSKASTILTTTSPSIMSFYVKYASENVSLGGTNVVFLEPGNSIQLQCTSDTDADEITFTHFTTTIRRFI